MTTYEINGRKVLLHDGRLYVEAEPWRDEPKADKPEERKGRKAKRHCRKCGGSHGPRGACDPKGLIDRQVLAREAAEFPKDDE